MASTCLKGGTECGDNRVKTPIYSASAVKGLNRNRWDFKRIIFIDCFYDHSERENPDSCYINP